MAPRKNHIDVITMGCSKNLVDSERLMKNVELKGFSVSHDPKVPSGEYVVVNTCGFIGDAKEESINMILQLARLKEENKIGKIIVMGCLSERYRDEIAKELPEVDGWFGKFDWVELAENLPDLSNKPKADTPHWDRTLTTPPWSAYVKISEGCNRFCAFCAIPHFTGRHKSRPMEEIVSEVESLVARGVKEFNIIAQDLSSYGTDLYATHKLPVLVDALATIPGVEWIRLHYLYPADFPIELLNVIRKRPNVCKYLDLALQHIADPVLENMNRKISKAGTIDLLKKIREEVPGIHIRTTIMTGFPGEGQTEFEELKEFVSEQKFERLGGFTYCKEEDTHAAQNFQDSIPENVKERRLGEIMALQQEISLQNNLAKVGSVMKVLVDRREDSDAIARSEFDSPEVDQEIIVKDCDATPGTFINVKITEALPFELIASELTDIN